VERWLHAVQVRLSVIGEGVPWYWLWLGLTLIILVLFVAYWRRVHPQLVAGVPPSGRTLMILALLIVVASLKATPTGDEPHFLVMTQSLLHDGDFNLRNNYLNGDYLQYHPVHISDPHVIVEGNHWYPIHSPGLPVLAAPWFAAGGRAGVVVMLAFLTVASLRLIWSLMTRAGFAPRARAGAILAVAFTLPLASMAGQVFSEMTAFFFTALALQAILAPALVGWDLAALAVSVAVLPWLHPKFTVLALGLLGAAVVAHRRRDVIKSLGVATGSFVASIVGVAFLTHAWYHSWIPGAQISLGGHSSWAQLLTKNFHVTAGYAGMLFDQQSGLLFASPVYVLAVAGILLLWRRERSLAIICALVVAAVYLPAASWSIWYGGYASPARLLTPLLPVLAVGIASALDGWETRARRLFYVLMVPSVLYAYLLVTLPDFTRYGDPATDHNYFIARFERLTHLDLTPLFPTFRPVSTTTWLTTAVYLAACLAMCIYVMAPRSRLAIRRPSFASPNAGLRAREGSATAITRGDWPGEHAKHGYEKEIAEHDD
jgi:hypothetical protein